METDPLVNDVTKFYDFENLNYDYGVDVGSMVVVEWRDISAVKKLYGVVRWIGKVEQIGSGDLLVGIELEDEFRKYATSDGTFNEKRYFNCHSNDNRAFFAKLSSCKPDLRFIERSQQQQHKQKQLQQQQKQVKQRYQVDLHSNQKHSGCTDITSIEGYIMPTYLQDKGLGRGKGIQGFHNSCYLDSTLFAMFSFSHLFDIALHRKKRFTDIPEYKTVQEILRKKIVNPLRKKGYVKYEGVYELRKYLEKLASATGFLSEEKDPEELVVLLFEKILKVDPLIKLAMIGGDHIEESLLYQIFVEKDTRHVMPTVQYLVEYSFLLSDLQLAEIPSVLILQMPRFGKEKLYNRIQISSELDITKLMPYSTHDCFICGRVAFGYCKQCACVLNKDTVFNYFCQRCYVVFHEHSSRKTHKSSEFKKIIRHTNNVLYDEKNNNYCKQPILDLFAVVCIEKSHYVSFVKTGEEDIAEWVFFDSMADRHGGESGHNIPEVTIVDVQELLCGDLSKIHSLDKKKDEKVLRLFQDASLCFYRYKDLSIYR